MRSRMFWTLGGGLSSPVLLGMILTTPVAAAERRVPDGYPTIQAAIDAADPNDEVIVAPGTYTGSGNRDLDLYGKAIIVRSTDPDDPNVVVATVLDCQGTQADPHRGFVFSSGEGAGSELAGLTVMGGYGPLETPEGILEPISVGGGVYCNGASPTIRNCRLFSNHAAMGGGILCFGSSPVIRKCTIVANSASVRGGGICCYLSSNPLIEASQITANAAGQFGGAIHCEASSLPAVQGCDIRQNSAELNGGAIACMDHAHAVIANSLMAGNSTGGSGSALWSYNRSRPALIGCTIVHNRSTGYAVDESAGGLQVTHCIVWGNVPGQVSATSGGPAIVYSDVQDGWAGTGNINEDPLFRSAGGSDGDANTVADNDYHLATASPCVNAGDPNTDWAGQFDIDGQPRVIGGRVDIGADEYSDPAERYVPSRYPTIQAAIDASYAGDTVVVAKGTYRGAGNRDLDFGGKAITVRSTDPGDPNVVAATIIDGQGSEADPHRGFRFRSNEGPNSVVRGLTITNGYGPLDPPCVGCTGRMSVGGGVYCLQSTPTIDRCVISGSRAEEGGGIYANIRGGTIVVSRCIIRGNTADRGGGAKFDGSSRISQSVIADNTAVQHGGGLLTIGWDVGLALANCTLANNAVVDPNQQGQAIFDIFGSTQFTNCIIWNNGITTVGGGPLSVRFSDVRGGWAGEGNIDADPLFARPGGKDGDPNTWQDNDYHLSGASPCINAGDPSGDYTGQTDIDGQPRVMEGRVDIGADERPVPTERRVPADYPTIQEAIDAAFDDDDVVLAPQTYTGSGNRDLDFRGKAITVRSTDPNDANVVAATVIDCQGSSDDPHRGFAFRSGEGPDSIVSGLTVTNGYGPNEPFDYPTGHEPNEASLGGAIYCAAGSPTIDRCTIRSNTAQYGGGIFAGDGSDLTISRSTISTNKAGCGGGGCGWTGSNLTFSQCMIDDNEASFFSGVVTWSGSRSTIRNCTIAGNRALYYVVIEGENMTIENCSIAGNTSTYFAIVHCSASRIANCSIVDNTVGSSGGITQMGVVVSWGDIPTTITNCILWGNQPVRLAYTSSEPLVTYCDVQGGWPGEGNIDEDPVFFDPNGPDGNRRTWQDNDYHLRAGSPCRNTGDPNGSYTGQTDIDGEPRQMGGRVDIGSDEWTYMSYTCGQGSLSALPLLALMPVIRIVSRRRRHGRRV